MRILHLCCKFHSTAALSNSFSRGVGRESGMEAVIHTEQNMWSKPVRLKLRTECWARSTMETPAAAHVAKKKTHRQKHIALCAVPDNTISQTRAEVSNSSVAREAKRKVQTFYIKAIPIVVKHWPRTDWHCGAQQEPTLDLLKGQTLFLKMNSYFNGECCQWFL